MRFSLRGIAIAVVSLSLVAVSAAADGPVADLAAAAPASAAPHGKNVSQDCLIGPGLGSTLLVPFFEYDPHSNLNTLVAVANGLAGNTLVRVVVWTDWGIPSLAFDIFLTGFDIQTFAVRDLFNGNIPSTGAGVDLSGYDYCSVLPPSHANPVLDSTQVAAILAMHQGEAIPGTSQCAGTDFGDDLVRGYITVDVVDECSGVEAIGPTFTPANTTYPYFVDGGGSSGIAIDHNTLWGDMLFIDDDNNFAQGTELVSIWADPTKFTGTNIYTFYGRYSGWDGRDDRVPLPYRWDQRFFNGGPYSGSAEIAVWRDTGSDSIATVTCGLKPSWWPLAGYFTAMDEDAGSFTQLNELSAPNATQKVDVSTLGIPVDFGWIQIEPNPIGQMWTQPSLGALGRFSISTNGTPVEDLCGQTPAR